ncbi:urease accessory protein UreH [Helicobacter didelphidarum]|uniref:Urease accessory protein UreH n=1 Tax=Helicobacter didelphidarum TaxID=2040648 RepID=A0A3D8INR0_9HELI|nr:urease accessory protein UreD [Helicobacter didelphidarum]RDU66221.1 urease accessory protein UreH [Helicobacter didelphidarum]
MTAYPQETKLKLSTKLGYGGKSVIDTLFFTPPLKIIEPFYENDIANVMLISVSAGLLAGDSQEIHLCVCEGSKLKLSSQSFEKIHDMGQDSAKRNSFIVVEKNALLDFSPLPTIPFANSSFYNSTQIYLQNSAKLYYSEIMTAGRVGIGEVFAFRNYDTRLKIYLENELIFVDNMLLQPNTMNLRNICRFGNFTHYLNLIIIDSNFQYDTALEWLQSQSIHAGITKIAHGYCFKALSHGSEELLNLCDNMKMMKNIR